MINDTKKKNNSRQTKGEVLAALDAFDKDFPSHSGQPSSELSEEFKKLFDEKLENKEFKVGQVVLGTILKATDDNILVDINYKSEGIIPRSEFRHFKEDEKLEEGKTVEVYIEQIENEDGIVVLSKDKANIKNAWENILKAKENDEIIKGKILAPVKGGLSVDVGIKAFLPGSQLDVRPVRNVDSFVGQTLEFKILKVNHKRGNIVLSRRVLLEKDRENLPKMADIVEGSIVKGIVKNITDYGAFIDLGDRDGLLHITDMSWSRIEHPSSLVKMGQELDLKILKYDTEKNRISLGLKQLNEAQWEEAVAKYHIGSVVKGKVSSVVEYGAFISLNEGLEGLVHINEISWTRKVKSPSQVLKVGEEIEVKIIDIKRDNRKLSLSIKQTQNNPWMQIKDKFSVGEVGEFSIVSISDFGVFVKLDDFIDGLVRVSDLSWTENIKPIEKYKVGDTIKAKVLDINPEEEKFSLGVKQLENNPWSLVEENYPIGSRYEVEVIRVVDFGAFVRIQNDVEGLIHISELSTQRVNKPQDVVNVGDKVMAEILSIDADAKKINLSIRLVESGEPAVTGHVSTGRKETKKQDAPFLENFFAKALKKSIKKEDDSEEN